MERRSMVVLLMVPLVLVLVGACGDGGGPAPAVLSVSIDQEGVVLEVGETAELSATVEVVGGASAEVEWASDDESVVAVSSEGVVTGVAEGEAAVVSTSVFDGSRSASVTVSVEATAVEPAVLSVSIDQGDVDLVLGATMPLTATVEVVGGASRAVVWSSEDEGVVVVSDEGVVTGAGEGEAEVSATSSFDGSHSASVVVTVVLGDVDGDVVYEFEPPVEVGSEATEVRVDDARVLLPGAVPGTSSSVQVAVSDAPVGGRAGLQQLSSVVAVRLSGDRAFVSDDPDGVPMLQVTLPVRAGSAVATHRNATPLAPFVIVRTSLPDGGYNDLIGQATWDDDAGAYTATVADPGSVCVGVVTISDECESAWWVADATPIIERENRVSSVSSAGRVGPADMRFSAGLHKVDAAAFAAAGGFCDTSESTWPWLVHDSDAHLWLRSADTALVFTHGWMVVAGMLAGLGGDDLPALPTHCTTWESFLYRIGHAGSDGDAWARIRTDADVFTYRYNTNDRVAVNAEDFAGRLQRLRDAGYERIVLVGHSMGGLVAHDARQRALSSAAWSGYGTSVLRVVTLATPYMGGPIMCTAAVGGRCISAVSTSLSLAWGLGPIDGLGSTLDLAAALDLTLAQRTRAGHVRIDPVLRTPLPRPFVRNPYLLGLWDRVDLDDRNTLAFVGSSGERPFIAAGMYSSVAGVLDGAWGYTDGIVPIASAVAATDLHRTVPRARLAAVSFIGRDHTYMASGCPTTDVGCPATQRAGDPHLENVARGIASWLATDVPSVDVHVSPSSVTLPLNGTQTFTASVTGASDTSVTWSATCGSVHESGSSVAYTAPAAVPPGATCFVRATSGVDVDAWDEATVTFPGAVPNQVMERVVEDLTATVVGYSGPAQEVYRQEVLGDGLIAIGSIETDGRLRLSFADPDHDERLRGVEGLVGYTLDSCPNVLVSDRDVQVTEFAFLAGDDFWYIGRATESLHEYPYDGAIDVFVYVDRPVTVSGWCESPWNAGFAVNQAYSQKGWYRVRGYAFTVNDVLTPGTSVLWPLDKQFDARPSFWSRDPF